MRDHLFTFPDASTEQKFLEMAQTSQVKTQWVAIDPDSQYNGEYKFATQEVWDNLPGSVKELIDEEIPKEQNTTPWPTTPFEEWTSEDQRKFIYMAVQEFECVGNRLPFHATFWRHSGKDGFQTPDQNRQGPRRLHPSRQEAPHRDQRIQIPIPHHRQNRQ